ncbi:MAG: 5-demethoxyubiquinol-8 5-hydroxylase UbiM [Alphaproteobacteria bacterium]|nr:5-demethoxyubiquinol-8 5-hydroxylase UbiM [Alphaproteobacteria bacterium]
MTKAFDIIIIGAGAIGLNFARALSDSSQSILILEKSTKETIENPPYDGREVAITHPSKKIMQDSGVWEAIGQEKISSIKHAKVLNGESSVSLDFDYDETDKTELGYLIANNVIRKASYNVVKDQKNLEMRFDVAVTDIQTSPEKAIVTLENGEMLETKLVVAADSRFSRAREMMGIEARTLDFGKTSIVFKMDCSKNDDTAYECFNYDQTVAVLPLNNNQAAVIVTVDTEEADNVLGMDETELAQDVAARINNAYGTMTLASERFSCPLVSTAARRFYDERFVLIGDAAVGMHPVTAQGLNLGLRGAHKLAEYLKKAETRQNPQATQKAIERYSHEHRHYAMPIYHGTNALVKLYTSNLKTTKFMRDGILKLGKRLTPIKQFVMEKLG